MRRCLNRTRPKCIVITVVRGSLTVSCQEIPDSVEVGGVASKNFELRCSFCGRLHTEVSKLVAGPGVYICDECVNLCIDVLSVASPAQPPAIPEWSSMSDDEVLQGL